MALHFFGIIFYGMKILELEYEEKTTGWKLENTKFDDFNLLVGLSGVGKTKILTAIENLKAISLGNPQNGVKWNIVFLDTENVVCKWSGEYESLKSYYRDEWDYSSERKEPTLISEKLIRDNQPVFNRTINRTNFNGQETPKLSPSISVFQLFSADKKIVSAANSLKQIIQFEPFFRMSFAVNLSIAKELSTDLDELKIRSIGAKTKLFLAFKYYPEVFKKIKQHFIEVFPSIQDIRFRKIREASEDATETVNFEIKEEDNKRWIKISDISEGMLKTLMHISQMYLYSDGMVFLIDEFENSLGINCIDVVTEILQENLHLQFIITSHHPYIINRIDPKYWKIVTRKGSVVSVKDIDEKNFARSHHEAFIKLLNLKEYREGIAA